jgi:hypothetical protein
VDDASKREALEEIIAERRKALQERAAWDPRAQALSRSLLHAGSRYRLPPKPGAKRSTLSIALLATFGALVLAACTATATAAVVSGTWLQGALSDPSTTVESFYAALQQKDYAGAYAYFSSGARAHMSEAAFADQFGGYDAVDGPVAGYSLGAPKHMPEGTTAIAVTVTRRGSAAPQVQTLELVKESGAWRIYDISIQQHSAPPAPAPHA